MYIKMIPNIITLMRILGTFLILFIKPLTASFYAVYTLTGITDILDGFVARKFNLTSNFGAKLDSVADLFFYSVMMVKILPVLYALLPHYIWYGVGIAILIRLLSYGVAAIKFHQFASTHSRLNKLTGLAVFCIPFVLLLPYRAALCGFVCCIAIISSTHELFIHIIKKA